MTDDRELCFDLVADEYERARADYPDAILDVVPLRADATVLDLAAGTGKLTRVLKRRYREVTAVEPLANMRRVLERVVPGVPAFDGTAERIPLPDAAVDAVFTAQAFHWFDKAVALPEMARVLRPGGILAVVWNEPDDSRENPLPDAFRKELDLLHESVAHPWRDEPEWEELLESTGLFAEVHRRTSVAHDHVLDRAGVLDNVRSVSWIASRDDREEVVARLGALLPEGTYGVPNLASIFWASTR